MSDTPFIVTLLTDFGTEDAYVGALHGAILSVDKRVRVVDISHHLGRHDIHRGAYLLDFVASTFPDGTVHCVVVDPGVGTTREAIVLAGGNQLFVGPDNGVLAPAVKRVKGREARRVEIPKAASSTFHGRDVFAPTAAKLASGSLSFQDLPPLESWIDLDFGEPLVLGAKELKASIICKDGFGNLVSNIEREKYANEFISGKFKLRCGGIETGLLYDCYEDAEGEEVFCLWGSGKKLEISLRQASAASLLEMGKGEEWPDIYVEFF